MSERTPGKWEIQNAYISEIAGQSEYIEPTIIVEGDDGGVRHIAIIRCGLPGSDANARLIAAAPDLLEACKAFSDVMRTVPEYQLMEAIARVYAQTMAAIAKAEGI